jgi:hypothetical protein
VPERKADDGGDQSGTTPEVSEHGTTAEGITSQRASASGPLENKGNECCYLTGPYAGSTTSRPTIVHFQHLTTPDPGWALNRDERHPAPL